MNLMVGIITDPPVIDRILYHLAENPPDVIQLDREARNARDRLRAVPEWMRLERSFHAVARGARFGVNGRWGPEHGRG